MLPVYILPGFNKHNLDWALQCQKVLPGSIVVQWQHWQTNSPAADWIEQEAQKIITQIGTQKVNFLAKSMGTAVAGLVATLHPELVNNIVFCGIPILDLPPGSEKYYLFLKEFPSYKALILQNDKDPHGKHAQIKEIFAPLNPQIDIIMTTRPDHEYPYFPEFLNFFQ